MFGAEARQGQEDGGVTDDELLTPLQIRLWARRVVEAMTPYERRIVAMALSSLMDERRAA